MPDTTVFWFARLVDATGKHLATETIHVNAGTEPADLIPELCNFFAADENGGFDEDTIEAGSIQLYGPLVVSDAVVCKARFDEDDNDFVGVVQ